MHGCHVCTCGFSIHGLLGFINPHNGTVGICLELYITVLDGASCSLSVYDCTAYVWEVTDCG